MYKHHPKNKILETSVLNKFQHIGILDYKNVEKELSKLETITNKLDYLKVIKGEYFDKYLTVFLSLNSVEKVFQNEILKSIFGDYKLLSLLQIQEPIYNKFFKELENKNIEYQHWFMLFSAEERFKSEINSKHYKEMITSNQREHYIKAELKEINNLTEAANQYKYSEIRDRKKGKGYSIDWRKSEEKKNTSWVFGDKETELIQIARILDLNYYKENIVNTNIDNLQAEIYFKYILYKKHLESLLSSYTIDKNHHNSKDIGVNDTNEEINKFCRTMELKIPRNHFKRLTTNNSKNGLPFLTEKQLENFIQKAFLGKDLKKEKINITPRGEKLLVQSIFYEFYDKYSYDYFGTNQNQDIFIRLMTENFTGWDFKKLKGNFKPKTAKRLV